MLEKFYDGLLAGVRAVTDEDMKRLEPQGEISAECQLLGDPIPQELRQVYCRFMLLRTEAGRIAAEVDNHGSKEERSRIAAEANAKNADADIVERTFSRLISELYGSEMRGRPVYIGKGWQLYTLKPRSMSFVLAPSGLSEMFGFDDEETVAGRAAAGNPGSVQ